ncbi:MAG: 2,3-bisphosphoglycerate-independent phosphoglycerate mutase [Methylococcales bacterium]|nr:2,3-bisphosphoglycerate-independent phosphoglycerate mutase [Methylococcales bacterium]
MSEKHSKPLVLLILDGFGSREETENNAIALAETPCWDRLSQTHPKTLIDCSGKVVGLPEGQMGNSEVGHLHIGSGRYVPQDLQRINDALEDGSFYHNPVLLKAVQHALDNDTALHIFGLLSPGGVHSHETQILAMVRLAAQQGLSKIYLHAFLDGRDVPPKSAEASLHNAEATFRELGVGRIATVSGRFYAMDRDKRWERVEQAYRALVKGDSEYRYDTALDALHAAYARDETDEFVAPSLIGTPASIAPEDSVVFMNFRADRAREISVAITDPDFTGFARDCPVHTGYYATLTQYHEDFSYPVAFAPLTVTNSLGEILSKHGLKQLRLSETEKYAHVTFFLNAGQEQPYPGEDRILVPSPKVKTYDLQPEMSAGEVTDHLVKAIEDQQYDVIICNYANCDMVGHTGNLEAAIKAVNTVDQCLARVEQALQGVGGRMLITADHGNIELMRDPDTGAPHTAHTSNLVPLVDVFGDRPLVARGGLPDLAPTLLAILELPQPEEMTGRALFS